MTLAIESSCDESAIAVFKEGEGIIGEWVHTQIALHQVYGGVVPGLAAREHLTNFGPLLQGALRECPEMRQANRVAVTYGPGLAPCLALGIGMAKAISIAWEIPVLGVNHLRGHAFSPFLPIYQQDPKKFKQVFESLLPHLGLIVSGGNTLLFKINTDSSINLLAQTVDDAAGEALDKGAKLLGMPYPGGPLVEQQALKGNKKAYRFPRAFPDASDMKFSFSGLKTSLRYKLESMNQDEIKNSMADICACYQDAVIGQLLTKTKQGLNQETFKSLGISGGVSNNKELRNTFLKLAESHDIPLCLAEPKHTGDNASMVAFAAHIDPAGLNHTGLNLSFAPSLPLA
ncbi:MAG: tRNA (adenosine(37)-N6)-threonylcarbamoyltransferase complex transferase subunit TsaD [Verrucomicrobia bacterium GWC2_42_7]|nr:MAG: tRNA (adenosine(37)-N6)-threonylcarbamoyltransferase complex transferase subunit TsaD [Verrucomicrobia bacterium GWC2_42_7]